MPEGCACITLDKFCWLFVLTVGLCPQSTCLVEGLVLTELECCEICMCVRVVYACVQLDCTQPGLSELRALQIIIMPTLGREFNIIKI